MMAREQLFTLACRTLDNAPNTIVVDCSSFAGLDLAPGTALISADGWLAVDDSLIVDCRNTHPWTPGVPDFSPLLGKGPEGLTRVSTTLERVMGQRGVLGGIRSHRLPANAIEAEVARLLREATRSLIAAMGRGDVAATFHWGSRLIGLGPGLTPAGDDFLTGLLALCAAPSMRLHAYTALLAELVRTHQGATTDISFTTLKEAARGRVRESIMAVLDAVANDNQDTLETAAQKVIAIGKTSGTDIVSGMQAGLQLENELRGWT